MISPVLTGIAAGLGAAGLLYGGCAYAALWPTSQIFGPTLVAPNNPDEIALTFDDGPNPTWTPILLKHLARRNVHATFFLVGSYAAREPNLVREIISAGHSVGNHSWRHPNLAFSTEAKIRLELVRSRSVLEEVTNQPVRLFRPPFGARRPAVLKIARSLGMVPVLWNAMTTDWSTPEATLIADRLTKKIDHNRQHGHASNVVLHDGNHMDPKADRGPSVAAAKLLLARYKDRCRFVRIDEWCEAK